MDAIQQYKRRLKRFKPATIIYALGTPIDNTPDKPIEDKPVPHLLQELGFSYAGKCSCSGTLNNKFSKGHYMIYWLPKRQEFHVKYVNSYIVKNHPVQLLCEKLKSLGIVGSQSSVAG